MLKFTNCMIFERATVNQPFKISYEPGLQKINSYARIQIRPW